MGSRYFLVEAAHRISSSTRNLFRQPSRITVLTPLPPLPRAMQRSNPELHKFVSEANKRVVTNEEFMANNEKLIANHKKYNNEQKWIDILLWPGAILGTLSFFGYNKDERSAYHHYVRVPEKLDAKDIKDKISRPVSTT